MNQANYMQVIDPKIAEIKYKIEQLKAKINNLWSDVREYDASLRQICGCQSNAWTATTPDGLGVTSGVSSIHCDYHRPISMNESRA